MVDARRLYASLWEDCLRRSATLDQEKRKLAEQTLALEQYPVGSYATPRQAFVAMTTDARFVCPSRTVARAMTAGQQEPVYRYLFSQTVENAPSAGGDDPSPPPARSARRAWYVSMAPSVGPSNRTSPS